MNDETRRSIDRASGLLRHYQQMFSQRNFTDRYGDANRCKHMADELEALFPRPEPSEAVKQPRCGTERYELDAYIWRRESTNEWVLELSGVINGCSFGARHSEPITTAPERIPDLPSHYTHTVPQPEPREAVGEARGASCGCYTADGPNGDPVLVRCSRHATHTAPQPEAWIPVSERLPSPDGAWVLVYADGAVNCLMYARKHGFYDATHARTHNIFLPNITHWMPLPAPPSSTDGGGK